METELNQFQEAVALRRSKDRSSSTFELKLQVYKEICIQEKTGACEIRFVNMSLPALDFAREHDCSCNMDDLRSMIIG